MIRSMTAFARREAQGTWGTLIWEIRSINHRYLEVSVRAPEELRALETRVRETVSKHLVRGKVDCTLKLQAGVDQSADVAVNDAMAKRVAAAAGRVRDLLPNAAPINVFDVLRWPGVLDAEPADARAIQDATLTLLGETLAELSEVRAREGKKLETFIAERATAMRAIVANVKTRMPEIAQRIRDKLQQRIAEMRVEVDANRFEQEMIFVLQKMDVAEEIGRLDAHLSELEHLLKQKEPVGRRLDFLMQEFHRESNTLGSKSVDIDSTRASVDLKVLIEQMREQVQNIE